MARTKTSGRAQHMLDVNKARQKKQEDNKENEDVPTANTPQKVTNRTVRTRNQNNMAALSSEIEGQKLQIEKLELELQQAQTTKTELHDEMITLDLEHQSSLLAQQTLRDENEAISQSLKDSRLKRGAVSRELNAATKDMGKAERRVRRLELQREKKREEYEIELEEMNAKLEVFEEENRNLRTHNSTLASQLNESNSLLRQARESIRQLRNKIYALEKQVRRAKDALKLVRSTLRGLQTWSPTKSGVYNSSARKLFRELKRAGCRNVGLAVRSCADAFGITVKRFVSRRTGARCIKEGGIYGLMQLGREISNTTSFGESTDGTTMRGITQECRHITLAVPSYAPDVDDSDPSTWTHTTRFAETAPALDHTAKRQFEGSVELGAKIAEVYSMSPLAKRDGQTMDPDDYFRKQRSQNMDHAADGRKKYNLTAEKKEQIVNRDLGQKKMEDMSAEDILREIMKVKEADILKAAGKTSANSHELTDKQRGEISIDLLEQRLGKQVFDALPEAEASVLKLFIFIGCGGHKSLNAFRYGVVEMKAAWAEAGLEGPCDLGNKGQDVAKQMAIENMDAEALATYVKTLPRGGVKLSELLGALFRHKNGETGYQDKHRMFMEARKQERYGLSAKESAKKYPDVSNTRYQCHSYAAAETLVFRDDLEELIEDICVGKQKAGANHLEGNALKGISDPDTLAELGAMAIEGLTTSWPYMGLIRSAPDGAKFVNALSPEMIALHRRIPAFCENLALHPEKVLDLNTPQDELTLDGAPFIDQTIIPTLRMLAPDLPNLNLMISAMFRGTACGWRRFTAEYADEPENPACIASLSPELLSLLGQIPMTNDANEGGLGSLRVYIRFNPSSNASMFSSQARASRNNTEAFINKLCQPDDLSYVMRLARKEDASGETKQFRQEYVRLQKERADTARSKAAEKARKIAEEVKRLTEIGVQTDRCLIVKMTKSQLKDQFKLHKEVRKDKWLAKVTQSSLGVKEMWISAILAAVTRMEYQVAGSSDSERSPDIAMLDVSESINASDGLDGSLNDDEMMELD